MRANDKKARFNKMGGGMKKLIQKIDDLLVAITFAEAGEYETATGILGEKMEGPEGVKDALEPGYETA